MYTKEEILNLIIKIGFVKLQLVYTETYYYINVNTTIYTAFWTDGHIRVYYDTLDDVVFSDNYDTVYKALKKEFNTELRKTTIKKLINE